MDLRPQLVIVASTSALADDLFTCLLGGDYGLTVVTTFASAKAHLRTHPHLVISELRLREYNGLHVALRARSEGIPAIVVGEPDAVLERDAEHLGVNYLKIDELRPERIRALVQELIPSTYADQHDDSGPTWRSHPSVVS